MNYFNLSLMAYLDPFTGSLLLQALFAIVISASVIFRRYIFAPITALFCRKAGRQDGDHELYE